MRKNNLQRLRFLTLLLAIPICCLFLLSTHSAAFTSDTDKPTPNGMLINHALSAIARDYLEPKLIDPAAMFKGALDQVERLIPEVLVTYDGSKSATVTVGIAKKKFRTGTISSLGDLNNNLIEIVAFITDHYHGDIEKPEIEYAAVEGMLSELDPHSAFLSPKVYKEFRVGTRGEFGGLGIVISIKDGDLTVVSPLEGTPAWRAGIKAGDKIIQIGDESTINMSLTDAVNKLRGKVGTRVKIVVSRPGKRAPFPVTITRAIINIDSIQKHIFAENNKRIGYIKVKSFQANTNDDFADALDSFHNGGELDGLILDFRNNPGGLLNQAITIADHFLKKGVIVKTVASRGVTMDQDIAHVQNTEPDYPIIVLLNEGSASASEIVAGALMDHDRALVMGRRSFGKGSVQTIFELGQGCAIKLTIAKYLPAGTKSIQSVGVTPDVKLVPKTVNREHMDLVSDVVQSETDLEKHLEKSGEKMEEPTYTVGYYQPYEKDEEDNMERRLKDYSNKPDVDKDFAVQLAKKLLLKTTSPSRKVMLEEIKEPLAVSEKEQQAIIFNKLAELGIDWSTIPKKDKSLLQLAYNIRKGNALIKSAGAGSKVELELIATNIGSGTYAQLVAIGQSESYLLKNLEFVFGKLKPGMKRSWRVPLTIPESMPTQELTMEVDFHEEHGNVPEALNIIIPVHAIQPPRFAFKYNLLEKANLTSGKTLHLTVTASNIGKGATSKEAVMALANKSGKEIFIQQGRAVLGVMKPGASKSSTFTFRAAKDFTEPKIKLELTIIDPKTMVLLTKEFSIDTRTAKLDPPANALYQPPTIAIADPVRNTADKTYDMSGTIRDTDDVRDYYIFVGTKKVAYSANAYNTNEMVLNASLPLEDGNNVVSIAARDRYELTGRKTVVIKKAEK